MSRGSPLIAGKDKIHLDARVVACVRPGVRSGIYSRFRATDGAIKKSAKRGLFLDEPFCCSPSMEATFCVAADIHGPAVRQPLGGQRDPPPKSDYQFMLGLNSVKQEVGIMTMPIPAPTRALCLHISRPRAPPDPVCALALTLPPTRASHPMVLTTRYAAAIGSAQYGGCAAAERRPGGERRSSGA